MLILYGFHCSLSFSWNSRCFSEERKSKYPETCLFARPLSLSAKIVRATSYLKDCRKFADFLFFKIQESIPFSYYKKNMILFGVQMGGEVRLKQERGEISY